MIIHSSTHATMCEWDVIVKDTCEDTVRSLVGDLETKLKTHGLNREYEPPSVEGDSAFFKFTGDEVIPAFALPSGYVLLHNQLVQRGYALTRSSAVDSAALFTK